MTSEAMLQHILDGFSAYYERATLAEALGRLVALALEEDRRTRPTLVGAPLDEAQLEAIRAHDRAATPPPWEWSRDYESGGELHWGISHPTDSGQSLWPLVSEATDPAWADASDPLFVCAARVAVPALLAHADFLHSLVADLSEDGSAYARGVNDGLERAALELERRFAEEEGEPQSCHRLARQVRALKGAAP